MLWQCDAFAGLYNKAAPPCYIRLESYEDALTNLRFQPLDDASQAALYALPDCFLRYMLDFETRAVPACWTLRNSTGRLPTNSTSPASRRRRPTRSIW